MLRVFGGFGLATGLELSSGRDYFDFWCYLSVFVDLCSIEGLSRRAQGSANMN